MPELTMQMPGLEGISFIKKVGTQSARALKALLMTPLPYLRLMSGQQDFQALSNHCSQPTRIYRWGKEIVLKGV